MQNGKVEFILLKNKPKFCATLCNNSQNESKTNQQSPQIIKSTPFAQQPSNYTANNYNDIVLTFPASAR